MTKYLILLTFTLSPIAVMAEEAPPLEAVPRVIHQPWCADEAITGTEQKPCHRTISFDIEHDAQRQLSNL